MIVMMKFWQLRGKTGLVYFDALEFWNTLSFKTIRNVGIFCGGVCLNTTVHNTNNLGFSNKLLWLFFKHNEDLVVICEILTAKGSHGLTRVRTALCPVVY